MAQLIVRGLKDETVRRLKQRAAQSGHSAEAEHRAILEVTLNSGPSDGVWEEMRRFRESLGPMKGDSVAAIRRQRRDA